MIKYIFTLILISNYVFAESTTERKMLVSKDQATQPKTQYWKCTDNTGISIYSKIPCDELEKQQKNELKNLVPIEIYRESNKITPQQAKEKKCQEIRTSHVIHPTPETRKYIKENCQ